MFSLRCFVLLFAAISCLPFTAHAETVDSKVSRVTLYRSQALVTRNVAVPGASGPREIIVENLPPQIIPGSLFAEGSESVEVRAVRFRSRAVGETPREDIRAIEQSLKELRQLLAVNQKKIEVAAKRVQYIESLKNFVAPTAQAEITKGVLNPEALEKLSLFSFEQLAAIAEEETQLAFEQAELNEKIQLQERKFAELTAGATREVFDAVIFADKKGDADAELTLSYMVNQCGWAPSYTFRASTERSDVAVEYNALVHQITGEDWSDVQITLSTASPGLSAAVPGLAPYHVTLASHSFTQAAEVQQSAPMHGEALAGQVRILRDKKNEALSAYRNSLEQSKNVDLNWRINIVANETQNLELVYSPEQIGALLAEADEGANIAYELASRVSVDSRNDHQIVRILSVRMKSEFYHVAIPVLSRQVYREAQLTNTGSSDFLAGPVTVYLDDRFVGKTEIPTVARGQTFVVGLGADSQMRTRRELIARKENFQGGNREVHFSYRLTVENFKPQAQNVRVFDRLPFTQDAMSVRVSLDDLATKLSEDPVYVRTEKPKGILRWDVVAAENAAGENAHVIDYAYSVDHDRNLQLTAASDAKTQQQEFFELQRNRTVPALPPVQKGGK